MSDELFLYIFYSPIAGYVVSLLLSYPLSKKYQIPLKDFNIIKPAILGAIAGIVSGVLLGCFFLFRENNLCGVASIVTAPVGMVLGEFFGLLRPIYIETRRKHKAERNTKS